MAKIDKPTVKKTVFIKGEGILDIADLYKLYYETKEDLDNANSCLSVYARENEQLKHQISELETELRVKEDLFAIKGAISDKKINLNDIIKVKLTPLGADIFYHQYDKLNKDYGRCVIEPHLPTVDEKGYTKLQLHQFMELYGEHIGIAKPNVIEPLDIILCD